MTTTNTVTILDTKASRAAEAAWRAARANGATPPEGAKAAWFAVRTVNQCLRAPYWGEAVDSNRPDGRRSYRCPLAQELFVDSVRFKDFGSHAGKWPRTARSMDEAAERIVEVLAILTELWG